MATRSENTVTINRSAEKVHEAFNTADYWAYIAANLSPEPGELNNFENKGTEGAQATLFEVLPLEILPEAVRAMISQALKLKRVVTVGPLADGKADITFTADVKGTPVDFSGEIAFAGDDATTTLSYDNEISVNIPFMGPAIEPKVGDALGELFDNEGKLTEQWISENL